MSTASHSPVIDPFTGAEFARVPLGGEAELELAIASAEKAFATTRSIAPHKRAALLLAVARGIEARSAEFAETITAEAGKPIALAEAEVARAVMTFTAASEEARRQHGEVLDMDAFVSGDGFLGITRRFPIGPIAAITPFNFPLNLAAHKIAPCIATGNTMIVKPAPKTPLTALLLADVLAQAGTPAGQMNFITLPNELAPRLVTDERVKMISFTGSPAVGWRLRGQAGKKKVCLELGGNAAVIVHDDADLATAIPLIATGGFAYAGQTCISVQRIFIHESIYDDFRTRLVAHIRTHIRAGDPRDRANLIGPMISRDALDRTLARIRSALDAGARLVCGGTASGPCIEATVLEDVPARHECIDCELFAPIVTLHRYREFDAALAAVNDSPFGLQAGVFTRRIDLALRAHDALEVGGVLINQTPTFRVENMPYGGVKDSGLGREGIRYAMEDMTEPRALIIRR